MGAHSGNRRWLGMWTHSGRHSDLPVFDVNSDEKVAPIREEPPDTGHGRHRASESAGDGRTLPLVPFPDPAADVRPEHRHRRSWLWGSAGVSATVASVLMIAVTGSSTHPDSSPNGRAPAVALPSPHDEPSESPLADPEPNAEPTAGMSATGAPETTPPSPQRSVPAPAGTITVTATPSGQAPAPVRPSGPVPTVTATRTVTQSPEQAAPGPTVTVTRTVRATETRYLPRPRVTVTITVSVPSLLP